MYAMNAINPIHDHAPLIARYKVRVTLIYDWGKDCNFADYQIVKNFCSNNNIAFGARGFDTYRYYEDKEFVQNLPAFQVYVLDEYERTLYPGSDVIQGLQAVILGVRIMDAEKRRRHQLFLNRLQSIWSYIAWIAPKTQRELRHTSANPESPSKPRKGFGLSRRSFAGSSELTGSNR